MSDDVNEAETGDPNANKAKNALVGVIFVLSILYALSTLFEWNLEEKVELAMSSLWGDPLTTTSENLTESAEIESKVKKSSSPKVSVSAEAAREDLIDLNKSEGQDELSEELMEDGLWEEGILSMRQEGVRSGKAVLEALAEIDNWSPVEGGYDLGKLQMYLRYPKLWVRLSAFAFALKAKVLDDMQETKMAQLITHKTRENPFQVRRFLQRYVDKDPELFQILTARLLEGKSASEEPPPPEVKEDPDNAS